MSLYLMPTTGVKMQITVTSSVVNVCRLVRLYEWGIPYLRREMPTQCSVHDLLSLHD